MTKEINKSKKVGCHESSNNALYDKNKTILLMGNPNVGKSVIFSKLTGKHVDSSNYVGTTVEYTTGDMKIGKEEYTLVDVPGTYSLQATSDAERVAVQFIEDGARVVICVLDATNLERNIHFALQLSKYDLPVIYTLNLVDVAKRQGIHIDIKELEQAIGAKVIATTAITGEGLEELKNEIEQVILNEESFKCAKGCKSCKHKNSSTKELWDVADKITDKVVEEKKVEKQFLDKLSDMMIKPWPGVPIAILVLLLSVGVIVGGGKGLRALILSPIISGALVPFLKTIVTSITEQGMLQNILIGDYGILVIGFQWIFELILPYVFMFYVVFSFLEDSGYLPRLAVLFDGLMSKINLQGGSLITILMGYGCAVPAIIGSRAATSKKERLIISTLVCFAVPCISQIGALIALLGGYSYWMVIAVFMLSLIVISIVAIVLSKVLDGEIEPMIIEIPNLLLPDKKAYFKKLKIRMKGFLNEAEVPMLIAVVIAAVLVETGLLNWFAYFLQPLVTNWLGLPEEAVLALVLGVVRREMAAAPLLMLDLSALQMFVGATVSLLYLPCISVFGVLAKEFNAKTAVFIGVGTVTTAFLVGGLINQIGSLFL